MPGFGLSLGVTLLYLGLIVLLPLAALALQGASAGAATLWQSATTPRALAALRISFTASFLAACVNGVFGLVVAWVLSRYRFAGRELLDALVDLPFALPTAVAGIALASLWAPNGWLGALLTPFGWQVAYRPAGIVVALVFVGLPFVVRSVAPVLHELSADVEEAAWVHGASRWQVFTRVLLPAVLPAWATGFALAFARGLGEYGSVIFIAGNLPLKSEIAPLLIVTKVEQYDLSGATAVALAMLAASFAMLLVINGVQGVARRWEAR